MPASVTGGGGIVQGEATISMPEPELVTDRKRGPWDRTGGWPPAPNDAVTVHLGGQAPGGSTSQVFTGRVSRPAGSTGGLLEVQAHDVSQRLADVELTHAPVVGAYHPMPGGTWGNVGMHAEHVVDAVLRLGGFYSTPPAPAPSSGNVFNAVLQGSLWPVRGTITYARNHGGVENSSPVWRRSPWGWCAADVQARYDAVGSVSVTSAGGIELTAMVPGDSTGTVTMTAALSNGGSINLVVTGRTRLSVTVQDSPGATVRRHDWTLPTLPWLQARAHVTAGGLYLSVHVPSTGYTMSTSAESTMPTATRSAVVTTVTVKADPAARVGHATVTGRGWGKTDPPPHYRARIVVGSLVHGPMMALPSLDRRSGLDLLREIATAQAACMWVDEDGVFQYHHPDVIRDQTPAHTLTADADLIDLAWDEDDTSQRSKVTVRWSKPSLERSTADAVTVHSGSGDRMRVGDVSEEFIGPDAGQDWVGVAPVTRLMDAASAAQHSRRVGTIMGGILAPTENQDGAQLQFAGASQLSTGLRQVAVNRWALEHRALSAPAGTEIELSSGDGTGGTLPVWPSARGMDLPIVRVRVRASWEDVDVTSATTGSPNADPMVHEAGPWVQDSSVIPSATLLADWLAAQVTTTHPVLRDLPLTWRADLRLGQVVTVREDAIYGVEATCLVIGLDREMSAGDDGIEASLSATVRVISIESTTQTYALDAAATPGATYETDPTPTYAG